MTVRKNISLGAYTRKDRAGVAADLERMMQLFPILRDRKNQMAGNLNGEEQQMLAIARVSWADRSCSSWMNPQSD
jgi:branched-chain amino acid transport system ATP-binding protein